MVAAANESQLFLAADDDTKGAFGAALRRPEGVTLTEEERRALKCIFGSVTKGVRTLIGRKKFERTVRLYRKRRAARTN